MSWKASKARKEREKTIKQSKNKKKKTKEPTPEQEPDILEEDVSDREKETTSEEESAAKSTVMPPQANPKRKRQDEVTLQPGDSLNLMFEYFDKKFEAMQNQIDQKYREPPQKRAMHNDYSFKVKVILYKSNSTLDYKMILRTFFTTKISTSRPLKLWTPSFPKYKRETNW